jgi:hypothetical protein
MHPLVGNLENLKEQEIHSKISDLTKKYFMTHNPEVQSQIANMLDEYRNELGARNAKLWQQQMENNSNKGLDKLININ